MRRILVDQARSKGRHKRGGGRQRVDIDAIGVAIQATPDQLLAIDEALEKLRREDAAVFELVKLRSFAGMNLEQAAEALGISTPICLSALELRPGVAARRVARFRRILTVGSQFL